MTYPSEKMTYLSEKKIKQIQQRKKRDFEIFCDYLASRPVLEMMLKYKVTRATIFDAVKDIKLALGEFDSQPRNYYVMATKKHAKWIQRIKEIYDIKE